MSSVYRNSSTFLRAISGIFLLYMAWWFLVTPQTFMSNYNLDESNFLAQLQHSLPSQEWNNIVQPAYLNAILLGRLLPSLAFFAAQAIIFWLGTFVIGLGIIHDVLSKTSAYQMVRRKVGVKSLRQWTILPYVFLLIDLSTAYYSIRVLSNFQPLESNPVVLALFEGNPLIYFTNLMFGTLLLLPCLFGIFFFEARSLISWRVREALILSLCVPFAVGIISNLAAILILH